MKINIEIEKERLEKIIADSEYLNHYCKNAPLLDDFQKASNNIVEFLYELDKNNVIDKPQWEFDKKEVMKDIKRKVVKRRPKF